MTVFKILAFALVLALVPVPVRATIYRPADLEQVTVSNVINGVVDGDIVLLPEGTANWTNFISINKRIRIIGANTPTLTNQTKIIWTGTNTGHQPFRLIPNNSNSNHIFGISYVTFDGNNDPDSADMIEIGNSVTTTNRFFRIHHNHLLNIRVRGINCIGLTEGLVDQNFGNMPYDRAAQLVTVQGYGRAGSIAAIKAASPSGTPALGITNFFVYIERNTLLADFANDAAIEIYRDAHVAVRSNIVRNSVMGVHDQTTNSYATVQEYYKNDIVITNTDAIRWSVIRGGWGVWWGNTVTMHASGVTNLLVQYYRASGTNVVLADDSTYYSMDTVAVAPSPPNSGTSLDVTFVNRLPPAPPSYQVNIWPDGVPASSTNVEIATVTAKSISGTTLTLTRGGSPISIATNYNISQLQVLAVTGTNIWDGNLTNTTTIGYPAQWQQGWGDPVTWTDTNGTPTFYGIYSWLNNVNGSTNNCVFQMHSFCNNPAINCNENLLAYDGTSFIPQTSDLVVEGRDVFSNTVKPGYVPLDQHPMALDITLSAPATNVIAGGTLQFTSSGGHGTPSYLLWENNSLATINESTGEYTAGTTVGAIDVVRVVDPIGGSSFWNVEIQEGGSIDSQTGVLLPILILQ